MDWHEVVKEMEIGHLFSFDNAKIDFISLLKMLESGKN